MGIWMGKIGIGGPVDNPVDNLWITSIPPSQSHMCLWITFASN